MGTSLSTISQSTQASEAQRKPRPAEVIKRRHSPTDSIAWIRRGERSGGNAVKITPRHLLTIGHCIENNRETLIFDTPDQSLAVDAKTVIRGEESDLPCDFAILQIRETAETTRIPIATLSTTPTASNAVRIKRNPTGIESTSLSNNTGSLSTRSFIYEQPSKPGDSSSAIFNRRAELFALHQGESEALSINSIIHSLISISQNPSHSKRHIAAELLNNIRVSDPQALDMHATTVPFGIDSVIPEADKQQIKAYIRQHRSSCNRLAQRIARDPGRPFAELLRAEHPQHPFFTIKFVRDHLFIHQHFTKDWEAADIRKAAHEVFEKRDTPASSLIVLDNALKAHIKNDQAAIAAAVQDAGHQNILFLSPRLTIYNDGNTNTRSSRHFLYATHETNGHRIIHHLETCFRNPEDITTDFNFHPTPGHANHGYYTRR